MNAPFRMTWRPNLAELGEALAGRFAELSQRPCADKCDYLLRDLHEARTAIEQMRARLIRGDQTTV